MTNPKDAFTRTPLSEREYVSYERMLSHLEAVDRDSWKKILDALQRYAEESPSSFRERHMLRSQAEPFQPFV